MLSGRLRSAVPIAGGCYWPEALLQHDGDVNVTKQELLGRCFFPVGGTSSRPSLEGWVPRCLP